MKWKWPDPPHIELNFYYHHLSEEEAFLNIIDCLLQRGGRLSDYGVARRNKKPFDYISNIPLEDKIEVDPQDIIFEQSKAYQDFSLLSVGMYNAIGLTPPDIREVVRFSGISSEAAAKGQRHPIVVYSTGVEINMIYITDMFEPGKIHELGFKHARKAYQRFLDIVKDTKPTYGAITIEDWIDCPWDLLSGNTYAFRDFYIDRSALGEKAVEAILAMTEGAYMEAVANGVYISMLRDGNPKRQELPRGKREKLSTQIGRIIGEVLYDGS